MSRHISQVLCGNIHVGLPERYGFFFAGNGGILQHDSQIFCGIVVRTFMECRSLFPEMGVWREHVLHMQENT